MGKFSKALEKADKEDAASPVDRPTPEGVISDMKISPSADQKPDRQGDKRQMANHQNQKMPAVEHSKDAQPSSASVPPPNADSIVPAMESALEVVTKHRLGNLPADIIEPLKEEPPIPSVETRSKIEAHTGRKPDNESIALSKSKILKSPRSVQAPPRDLVPAKRDRQTHTTGEPTSGNNVRVQYSKTQVQINDPETLRKNKILSVFDDIETTEQIKILRTQVLRKLKAIGGNSLLVASANPYEGKTFTSINLGVSIAKEFDRTVLIIDADIRKPTRHHTSFSTEFFSLKVQCGLTDYLEGDVDISDILINPGIDKLTLIPGGVPVVNSPELLNSGRMEEMMQEIKSRYPSDRVVIVDGPAILPFTDAMILSRYVDGVILVIEAEKTSGDDLKKMMLRLKGVNVLGMVLNKNKG